MNILIPGKINPLKRKGSSTIEESSVGGAITIGETTSV